LKLYSCIDSYQRTTFGMLVFRYFRFRWSMRIIT
jgi:hypothetical protein